MANSDPSPALASAIWTKSRHSSNNGMCVEVGRGVMWAKSSHSFNNGECVELAHGPAWVAVRDSKNPGGPALVMEPAVLRGLVRRLHG